MSATEARAGVANEPQVSGKCKGGGAVVNTGSETGIGAAGAVDRAPGWGCRCACESPDVYPGLWLIPIRVSVSVELRGLGEIPGRAGTAPAALG